MQKKFHLAWFGGAGHGADADTWIKTGIGYDWSTPESYRDIAWACERAKFDFVFFADLLAMPETFQGSWDHYVRSGLWTPNLDPLSILGMLSAQTKDIGLISTVSTSHYPPYLAARTLSTLDHMSRGRVGWNIVTSIQKSGAQNFGQDDLLGHDERYDAADEYVDLCNQLWNSWEDGSVLLDRENRVFGDPSKIHRVNFEGKYFKCRGPLSTSRSPQGRPVTVSAGSSPRGMRYAAEHADLTVISKGGAEDMHNFSAGFSDLLAKAGRSRKDCKIFTLFRPIIGETESIARERMEAQLASLSLESGLATLSEVFGMDLSTFDPDKPLPPNMPINALASRYDDYYRTSQPTLREIAKISARNAGFPICGTPEHVADVLEQTAKDGDIDGFFLRTAPEDYRTLFDFIDLVVPILQRRGLTRTEYSGKHLRDHLAEF